jgi:hypothetical protein
MKKKKYEVTEEGERGSDKFISNRILPMLCVRSFKTLMKQQQ